jgi:DNA sulfur modification protein DndB
MTEPAKTFPGLRARMGERWYYVTTMTFADVARWVRPVDEIHERAEFKTWLQRLVKEQRKVQIAEYLRIKPQRFFNAVVVGIYGGEPEWLPVTVDNTRKLEDVELGERQATAYGVISISGNEEIFAIDGQHRVEGIREALKAGEDLAEEELTVIFVAHKTTDEGRERTRRLFTTLNKYAKPVSQGELTNIRD